MVSHWKSILLISHTDGFHSLFLPIFAHNSLIITSTIMVRFRGLQNTSSVKSAIKLSVAVVERTAVVQLAMATISSLVRAATLYCSHREINHSLCLP